MPKGQPSRKARSADVIIQLAGVGPQTHLGELTVQQFVQLITQVSSQLGALQQAQKAKTMDQVVQQLRKEWTADANAKKSEIGKRILQAQLAILDKVPAVAHRTSGRRLPTKT